MKKHLKFFKLFLFATCFIGCLPFLVNAADIDAEVLEISIDKIKNAEGDISYEIRFYLSKNDAATCELLTSSGTYPCIKEDGSLSYVPNELYTFIPDAPFKESHTGLTLEEVEEEISEDWVFTWDKGTATETTATIDFGLIEEGDWPLIPAINDPANGETGVSPTTSISWSYEGVSNSVAQEHNAVSVCLSGPDDVFIDSDELEDELPTASSSWTPPSALGPGRWLVSVHNGSQPRLVPEGITITGDEWILDNGDWLSLNSISEAVFTVGETQGIKFSDYFAPGSEGDTWTYRDLEGATFTWVLEKITSGTNAGRMKLGNETSGYVYDINEGAVTWYDTPDAVPDSPISFPEYIEAEKEIDFEDDGSKVIYLVAQNITVQAGTYDDVLIEVWLDENFPPNSMNESLNLGGMTASAVTDVCWYVNGLGLVKFFGIDAETGENDGNGYELVAHTVGVDKGSDGGSGGGGGGGCFIATAYAGSAVPCLILMIAAAFIGIVRKIRE